MGLGVVLALFYRPSLWTWGSLPTLVLAVLAANVIASSNYVSNELIDAPGDRRHPLKRLRLAAAGMIRPVAALVE